MTAISSIQVNVQTKASAGAGTDGDVYLGFAGREFWLDTSADDFESGSSRTYRLGAGGREHSQRRGQRPEKPCPAGRVG